MAGPNPNLLSSKQALCPSYSIFVKYHMGRAHALDKILSEWYMMITVLYSRLR